MSFTERNLRILLIAEACNPEWTSVPLVGFNMVKALAERSDLRITLATHPRNRSALERNSISSKVEIIYPDNEYIAARLHRLAQFLRGDSGKGWTTNTAFESISYLFFEKELYKLISARLSAGEFDLIHRITPVTPSVGSPLATLTDVPMILGPLNGGLPWPVQYPGLRIKENEYLVPLRKIYKIFPYYSSTYRKLSACISGSQHTATEIPPSFSGRRFQLPENGVDPATFQIAEGWTPPSRTFRFVTVGRLVPYKGLWLTLSAMRDSQLLKKSELVVIGDGPERAKLEKMIQDFDLGGCVRMLGHLDQLSLSREMRSSQCFVFPSLREFGGGVVVEAMACGLPSIVVDYGGPRELVDSQSGILLPMQPEDFMISSLRDAMERLLVNPDLCRSLALHAVNRVRSEFTWEVKASKVDLIYHEIAAANISGHNS